MVDGLQRIAGRIDAIGRTEILPVRAKYLLTLVDSNILADQYNVVGIGRRQFGRGFYLDVRNGSQHFGVAIKPRGEDDDQTADHDTDNSGYDEPKDARCNGSSRGVGRQLGRSAAL